MSTTKKRKISGLELGLLARLRQLRSSIDEEDTFADQLDGLITTLGTQVNSPVSFSPAINKALERVKIVNKGLLVLHPAAELRKAIDASRTLGSDELWSNETMYKHLSFLANSFTNQNGTTSRVVIDTFFFRLTAMVPSPQKVIVMLGDQISAVRPTLSRTDAISGIIDYTAVVVASSVTNERLCITPTVYQHYGGAFFAAEAKASVVAITFEDHLPHVVLELVASAKSLGKSHVRGALTTGTKWYFIVVDLNANDDGATYWVSEPIEWKTKRDPASRERIIEETSDESDPALIAGILSSWVPESFTEFGGDQWFTRDPDV